MTSEKKPEGVRKELFQDWGMECKRFLSIIPIERRSIAMDLGVLFHLEGKKYMLRSNAFYKTLHIEDMEDEGDYHTLVNRSRMIKHVETGRDGIPLVDLSQLQQFIDEMSVEELMRE